MTKLCERILVLGYGNPGRLDDGLGPRFAQTIEAMHLPGVDVEADYQLTIEDAELISRYRAVLFVDATVAGAEPYALTQVEADAGASFTTHHVEPSQLLHLARSLFHADTQAWILGVRGYDYNEFGERLSDQARDNLAAAVDYFLSSYQQPAFLRATTSTHCS